MPIYTNGNIQLLEKKSTACGFQRSALAAFSPKIYVQTGHNYSKKNFELSPLFLHIPLLIVNIHFEFQVYMFSNGRDMTKCLSFCTKTTTTTCTPRL